MENITLNDLLNANPLKLDGVKLFKYKNKLKSFLYDSDKTETTRIIQNKLVEYQKAIDKLVETNKKTNEDAAATQGNTSGLGAITGSTPSANVGVTTGDAYAAGGGTIGSGDISVPFNAYYSPLNWANSKPRLVSSDNFVYTTFLQRKKSPKNNTTKASYAINLKPASKVLNYQNYLKKLMGESLKESFITDLTQIIDDTNIKNSEDDKYTYEIHIPENLKIDDKNYTDIIKLLENFKLKYYVDIKNKIIFVE